jgi:putative oxidoreductase
MYIRKAVKEKVNQTAALLKPFPAIAGEKNSTVMKKLMSTNYNANAFNFAMLLFRIVIGVMMLHAGYYKLVHFSEMLTSGQFQSMIGIGAKAELAMLVFAEFFCSIFLILGLFTRLSTIPLIIAMLVAFFMAHHAEVFTKEGTLQAALIYLCGYFILILLGPGKISVDGLAGK